MHRNSPFSWQSERSRTIKIMTAAVLMRRLPQPGQLMLGDELLGYHNNNNV